MKLGIIGLPQTGKKNLFELLTGSALTETQLAGNKAVLGYAVIRDSRFDSLVSMYRPKKQTPAQIDLVLLSKIEKNPQSDAQLFREIEDVDAICHIVRAFTDESIYHIDGSVAPLRDIATVNDEFVLHDLLFVEKRLERIEKESKKRNDLSVKKEEDLLRRFQVELEKDRPLRLVEISEEESMIIKSYPFLTRKKLLLVCNINDSAINDDSLIREVMAGFGALGVDVMQVSAQMEKEIASLENPEDRKEFMDDAGITEPALHVLSRMAMDSLGLISFFTVGDDEVKQWQIPAGSTAPQAAGVIHSDIERGFIRAEVIRYQDLIDAGSEENVKKAGKTYTMGRDYIVQDGDIISFRFNV